ncbi:MAG: DMT family transporter [Thermodesulfobacteriota bacterium]
MTRKSAALALAVTALLWSVGGVFIKSVEWNPLAIAGARSGIAAVFLALALGKPKIRLSWPLVGAAVSTAACMLMFVTATRLTTAANAVMLQYLAPIHVALLAPRFLGEPTKRHDWAALAMALCGMVLFFWEDVSPEGKLGITLAVGSSFAFAGIPLFLRKLGGKGGQTEAVLLGNALLALVCLPFYFQGGLPDAKGVGALLILGVVQTGLAYFIYTKAVRHVNALPAILIPVIEPVLNPVWVFLFIGEKPSFTALLGGLVVLGAATMQGIFAARGR